MVNLEELDLASNNITEITSLKNLTNLEKLDLSWNSLTNLFDIQGLLNLKELNLSGNNLTEIFHLNGLINLEKLGLGHNNLTTLSGIKGLTNLRKLDLSDNNTTDISGLKSLTNLKILDISRNNLPNTEYIDNLLDLEELDLSDNNLTVIPTFLLTHPKLRKLSLKNNPINEIEPALLDNDEDTCLQKIRDYYKALNKYGYNINNEAKLILLGNGRSGKSSILNRLIDNSFNDHQTSTHGIQLRKWCLEVDIGQFLIINTCDFGGQDIYHGTHRLFMANKTLYLLVWDAILEFEPYYEDEKGNRFKNYPIVYWLDYIKTFSPQSPVIIVQNKTDLTGKRPPDNYFYLKEHYHIC